MSLHAYCSVIFHLFSPMLCSNTQFCLKIKYMWRVPAETDLLCLIPVLNEILSQSYTCGELFIILKIRSII